MKLYYDIYYILMSCLRLSFLTFGGGVATISFIHNEFVVRNKFVSEDEFKDIVLLANTLPGATMLQIITYIANKRAGFLGFIISFIIMLFTGPILLAAALLYAYSHIDLVYMHKAAQGILPVIIGMLNVFSIRMLLSDIKKTNYYNIVLYLFILLITFVALLFHINIAIIFIVIILFLILYNNKIK